MSAFCNLGQPLNSPGQSASYVSSPFGFHAASVQNGLVPVIRCTWLECRPQELRAVQPHAAKIWPDIYGPVSLPRSLQLFGGYPNNIFLLPGNFGAAWIVRNRVHSQHLSVHSADTFDAGETGDTPVPNGLSVIYRLCICAVRWFPFPYVQRRYRRTVFSCVCSRPDSWIFKPGFTYNLRPEAVRCHLLLSLQTVRLGAPSRLT